MANLNVGIGLSNTLVTLFDNDNFPLISSNDILGGIHSITASDFNRIPILRRQLGMLVYVEPENTYYRLEHINSGLFNRSDNGNFREFKVEGALTEWVDSVLGVYNDSNIIPNGQRLGGNRFLVGANGTNDFSGHNNKIAIFNNINSGSFNFISPLNGTTLRVDNDPGTIYKFVGTSSTTGKWEKELQNQVRYIYPTSNNGLTYSFITNNGQTPLATYSNFIFGANFGTANAGSVTLSIDGNSYTPVRKISSNILVELSANDIGSNVIYLMTYDNGSFQILLPSSGQGGTIGPAEDGTYTDGLFTDFDPSTPIGTPIDRFNEILKALVPPGAPNLNSWSATSNIFVPGKISYTTGQAAGINYTNAPGLGQGDLFDVSPPRLGITNKVGNITGVLNSGVAVSTQQPTPAYGANAFGNGLTGSIVLYINSQTASTINLGSSSGPLTNTTSDGSLTVSASTSSKFATGVPFENSFWRTGTYNVSKTSALMRNGYNEISIKHILPSQELIPPGYNFLIDAETDVTTLSPNAATINLGGKKFISGIEYYTSGNIGYSVEANNIYKNTYYHSSDAGLFSDQTTSAQSQSPIYNGQTRPTNSDSIFAFSPVPTTESLPLPNNVGSLFEFNSTFNLLPNRRKINGGATFRITAKRTVQPSVNGGDVSVSNLFIDSFTQISNNLVEDFNGELLRKPNSIFNTKSDVDSATWDSEISLYNGGSTYQNALQVADGRLLYPSFNFRSDGSLLTNPNYNITSSQYNLCGVNTVGAIRGGDANGYRTYTRLFKFGATSYPKFTLKINAIGTTYVGINTSLVSQPTYVQIEFKLPYKGTPPIPGGGLINGGAVTGWLDATKPYSALVSPIDGEGCLSGNIPIQNDADWKIDFGTRETGFSDGYVLMRITAGKSWTGHIENIQLIPG